MWRQGGRCRLPATTAREDTIIIFNAGSCGMSFVWSGRRGGGALLCGLLVRRRLERTTVGTRVLRYQLRDALNAPHAVCRSITATSGIVRPQIARRSMGIRPGYCRCKVDVLNVLDQSSLSKNCVDDTPTRWRREI